MSTRSALSLLALLAACGQPALPPLAEGPAAVSVDLASKRVEAGEPAVVTLRVAAAEGWTVPEPAVSVEGLTVEVAEPPTSSLRGARTVSTQVLHLNGPDGSYVLDLPPVQASSATGETAQLDPPPVFFDIGVAGPTSEVTGFQAPPAAPSTPWWWWALGAGFLASAAITAGFFVWVRRYKEGAIPLSPEQAARQQWQEAKASAAAGALDDPALAVALSRVFRGWLETTLAFPATARTSREILQYLDHNGLLQGDDRARCERLLRATDRLKFAREGGGDTFFAELEQDFDAVLVSARPQPASTAESPLPESPLPESPLPESPRPDSASEAADA